MNYTPAQVEWFLEAISAEERRKHKRDVHGARAAQLEPKHLADYLRQVDADGDVGKS